MMRLVYRWRTMTPIQRLDYYAAALTLLVVIAAVTWLGKAN